MRKLSGEGFAVLPDGAAGQAAAEALGGAVVLDYPSGRPCLLAARPGEVTHAEAGRAKLAVIGTCPVTAGRLQELAARLGCLEDADLVAAALPGSFHLVAVVGNRARVQGTASGMRRVYYTRVSGGSVVASDRAAVLGAGVDGEAVAVRLLSAVPPPLDRPLWEGVATVPPGDAAHIDAYGVRLRTWWRPPEPHLPVEDGAPMLARALAQAVDARVAAGAVVASDLSGGLDSTPVSFLAATAARDRSARLVTFGVGAFGVEAGDPAQDDEVWAALARAHLPGEHVVARPGELPGWFAGVAEPVPGLDEPMWWLRVLARERACAALLAERGAAVHLTGHGGDELTLLPREQPPRLPGWATPAAADAVRRRLAAVTSSPAPPEAPFSLVRVRPPASHSAARTGPEVPYALRAHPETPFSLLRAQHQTLSNARATAAVLDGLRILTARAGAAVHAPYLDDHVIAACLAIRLDGRAAPGAYKPLTLAAMRPVMPPECLRRTTKGAFSADFYQGLRRHRDQLLALLDGSLLVERGLADPDALRRTCVHTPPDAGPGMPALDVFIAVENWLRAQQLNGGGRAAA